MALPSFQKRRVDRDAELEARSSFKAGNREPVEFTEFYLAEKFESEALREYFVRAYKRELKKLVEHEESEKIRVQGLIDRELDDLLRREGLYVNPTRSFEVGDGVEVILANWQNCKIVRVHTSGLFYLIEYTTNNFGRGPEQTGYSWKPWSRIRKPTDHKENLNKRLENRVFNISFHNSQVGSLLTNYFSFGVDMEPEYQRGVVWELSDKQKLIESIFEGIEIGKFVFIHLGYGREGGPMYEILDGKQRLTAIVEFVTDRFQYKGKYFSELSHEDQSYFESFSITMGETREIMTLEQKAQYFLRLNVSGVQQDEEHLDRVRKLAGK